MNLNNPKKSIQSLLPYSNLAWLAAVHSCHPGIFLHRHPGAPLHVSPVLAHLCPVSYVFIFFITPLFWRCTSSHCFLRKGVWEVNFLRPCSLQRSLFSLFYLHLWCIIWLEIEFYVWIYFPAECWRLCPIAVWLLVCWESKAVLILFM